MDYQPLSQRGDDFSDPLASLAEDLLQCHQASPPSSPSTATPKAHHASLPSPSLQPQHPGSITPTSFVFSNAEALDLELDIGALSDHTNFSSSQQSSPMDLSSKDLFTHMYSDNGIPLHDQQLLHPFDTVDSSYLTPSPLDLSGCESDPFNRQLYSAILSPIDTLGHSDSNHGPFSSAQIMDQNQGHEQSDHELLSAVTSFGLDPHGDSSDGAVSMEIIDSKISPFLFPGTNNSQKKAASTTSGKDRASEKKPTKRHSVSRQAQQPPLVTHQHHTPPPYVSPLLHSSHQHHHHHHHKTGSLDLTHTSYGQFLQQQHRHQIQHGHMPSVGLVATQMQGMLNSNKSSTDMINMSPVHSVDHHDISSSPSTLSHSGSTCTLQHGSGGLLDPHLSSPSSSSQGSSSMSCGFGVHSGAQRPQAGLRRRLTKDKLAKNDREEVRTH